MSNKKGKKSKGVTMSLQDFALKVEEDAGHSTPGSGQNVVYADKKPKPMMSSWADEVEEDGSFFEKERLILPSAPRAARGPAYEDHMIPKSPPFTAHLGNLPYDISDEEIYKFFRDLGVDELKLPRDQQTNRLRGFGYIDFLTREDLIEALIRNEQTLRGRPIRITLGNGQQQDRRGGDMDRGMRGDGERRRRPPAEDDDVDDWRSVMKPQGFEGEGGGEPEFRRGPPSGPGDYGSMPRSGGYNRDRGYGPPRGGPRGPPPDEELDFSRSSMMQGPPPGPPPQHYNTYGGRGSGPRGGYQQRDRDYNDYRGGDRDRYGGDQSFYRGGGGPPSGPPSMHNYPPSSHSRHHSESSDAETGGTWRRGREHTVSQRSDSSSHNYGPPSSSYVPPHHQRSESPPMRRAMSPGSDYGPPSRGPPRDRDSRDEDNESPPLPPQPQPPKERKRLVLQPRTVDKPVGEADVGSASIFGGAKPVDTTKREREIEEKLEKLKVDVPPKEETESSELASGGEEGSEAPPRQPRSDRGDRERERGGPSEGRPKQFRLLTRNNSGSNGKDAYIDVEAPFESLKGPALTSSAAPSSSRSRLPMQAPPPLGQAYTSQRFSQLRSDDKDRDRGLGDRDRDRSGSYRGGRGGPSRRGEMDRGGPRGGGEFRRRDHDGPPSGRGGGRSFDSDHGRPSRGGRGGYGGGRDDYRERDDFRRSHHNNNQSSSIGSQSEERDRDSHSEPEDDRDMMRGGGEKTGGGGGEFSDDSGDFTRVERRGRKSFNNRVNNNPNPNNNRAGEPRQRNFYN